MKLIELTTKSPPNEWQGAQKDINAPPCRTPIALHISLLTRMVINWSWSVNVWQNLPAKKKTLPLGTPKWKSLKRFKDANFWFWKKITAGYFVFQVQVLEGISSFKMLETKTTCKPMIHTRSTTCVFGYGPMTLYMPWPFIMPVSKRPFLSIAPEKTTCIYPIYTHHKRCIYRVDYSGAPIPKLPPHVSPTNNPTSGW